MRPSISKFCFACGERNPIGLRLRIEGDTQRVSTHFRPRREHEGWEGVTHGGIIATLLDEVLAWICVKNGLNAVTARIDVKFRRPAKVGEEISAHAELTQVRGNHVKGRAEVRSRDGGLIAEADALLLRVSALP